MKWSASDKSYIKCCFNTCKYEWVSVFFLVFSYYLLPEFTGFWDFLYDSIWFKFFYVSWRGHNSQVSWVVVQITQYNSHLDSFDTCITGTWISLVMTGCVWIALIWWGVCCLLAAGRWSFLVSPGFLHR